MVLLVLLQRRKISRKTIATSGNACVHCSSIKISWFSFALLYEMLIYFHLNIFGGFSKIMYLVIVCMWPDRFFTYLNISSCILKVAHGFVFIIQWQDLKLLNSYYQFNENLTNKKAWFRVVHEDFSKYGHWWRMWSSGVQLSGLKMVDFITLRCSHL